MSPFVRQGPRGHLHEDDPAEGGTAKGPEKQGAGGVSQCHSPASRLFVLPATRFGGDNPCYPSRAAGRRGGNPCPRQSPVTSPLASEGAASCHPPAPPPRRVVTSGP